MFCDHSIEVVTWELRYRSPDHSAVWNRTYDALTAETLDEFFQRYLADPWALM